MKCWTTLYTGYPNIVRLDQEAGFAAKEFRDLATAHGIDLQFSGAQSHNSIGVSEKYREPPLRVFRIFRTSYPDLEPEVLLRYATKDLNDRMDPEGYVPSSLVF